MELKEILVVVPHSGILIPGEIPIGSLSDDFPRLMRNVDWYTNWLYNFRDILGNSHLAFPYCSLILEANRHPENIDDSVPLKDTLGEPVYRAGNEPTRELRQFLSDKYLQLFHHDIGEEIARGKTFLLDAHSTVTAKGVADSQIDLMNFQVSKPSGEKTYFCPDVYIETYADELVKRLSWVKVTVNQSKYSNVYGHVCGAHSINAMTRIGNRVPAILQETNQKLYMNEDRTLHWKALETLRRVFAEALQEMMKKVRLG